MDPLASSAGIGVKCSQMEDPLPEAPTELIPLSNTPGSNPNCSQVEDSPAEAPTEPITIELRGDEFWPLSGKPFFCIIMTKTQLKYRLAVPAKMHLVLPPHVIPAYLTYKGKEWKMVYHGKPKSEGKQCLPRFDHGWTAFASDNNLKIGDGCVFELTECSNEKLKFRVQILRDEIPSELPRNMEVEKQDHPVE